VLVNQLFLLTQITFCLILIAGVGSGEEKNLKNERMYVEHNMRHKKQHMKMKQIRPINRDLIH